MPRDTPVAPTTPLDDLWAELLLDACASDGPIRDNDVRQAIKHYRPKIEAALDRSTPAEALREALEHVLDVWAAPSPEEFARLHRVLTGHDSCSPHNREADR
jgi:hypothetical protein